MFADEVTVIGVAGRDDLEVFERWVASNNVDAFDHIADVDQVVWQEFGIRSQPAFAFINDDGVAETHVGKLGPESLSARVIQLIAS